MEYASGMASTVRFSILFVCCLGMAWSVAVLIDREDQQQNEPEVRTVIERVYVGDPDHVCPEAPQTIEPVVSSPVEVAELRAENARLHDELAIFKQPRLTDQEGLGLTLSERVRITTVVREFVDDATKDASPYTSHLRSQEFRQVMSHILGPERLRGIEGDLWAEYKERHGGNILQFAATNRFRQRLFGFLCYSRITEKRR